MQKKLIALSVIFIVLKYAIFGTVVYQAVNSEHIDILWFCVGIASLMFSVLLQSAHTNILGKEDGV